MFGHCCAAEILQPTLQNNHCAIASSPHLQEHNLSTSAASERARPPLMLPWRKAQRGAISQPRCAISADRGKAARAHCTGCTRVVFHEVLRQARQRPKSACRRLQHNADAESHHMKSTSGAISSGKSGPLSNWAQCQRHALWKCLQTGWRSRHG